ncbi:MULTISPECIES: NAD(P)/FAD-dependent oxidoreductase [Catenuloplanes]|uniref:Glycine/D-amino acid oxidase-like deaminating enzyme n=1 Tax=Catenuloplanes niger TaxID=587534 RepID=A0AAE4CWV5_9ACTN|nr:FAD-dependent oxidoreductase [Catenuloplanes niger]MDR7326817.1 glycine/D-amino acid oxidase-like deaminating enzyme [Catenuloplanes niger]
MVIVGNGALGLFLADELVERKVGSVVVVGPSHRDAGASRAAGAMLGCFGEVTSESLRTDASRTRFELGVQAHSRWPEVLRKLEEHSSTGFPLQTATETHVVLNAIGAELDTVNFEAMLKALDEYGKPWSPIDPADIPGFRPRTDARALRAVHLHDEGAVDARGVLAALETRLDAAGATLLDQTVRRLTGNADAVTGVELEDGSIIEAGKVVVAVGARSEALVRTVAKETELIPTFPGLGFAMIAKRTAGEPFRSVVRTPNRGFACGLHVVPAGPGREYLGATNRLVDDIASVTWIADVRYLAQYSMQQLDEQIARHEVLQWLSGNRPVTLDGFPMIGWLPTSGLYLMTGTYRDGFHCAPLLATHVANELQGKPGTIDPMFNPVRQPIQTRTVEASVEEYVQHNMAAWFETGAEAAPQMTTTQLAAYYRARGTEFYEKIGSGYALGPDVLWYAEGSLVGARRVARYLRRVGDAPSLAPATSGIGESR